MDCPGCGEWLRGAMAICPMCGTLLSTPAPGTGSARPVAPILKCKLPPWPQPRNQHASWAVVELGELVLELFLAIFDFV